MEVRAALLHETTEWYAWRKIGIVMNKTYRQNFALTFENTYRERHGMQEMNNSWDADNRSSWYGRSDAWEKLRDPNSEAFRHLLGDVREDYPAARELLDQVLWGE